MQCYGILILAKDVHIVILKNYLLIDIYIQIEDGGMHSYQERKYLALVKRKLWNYNNKLFIQSISY